MTRISSQTESKTLTDFVTKELQSLLQQLNHRSRGLLNRELDMDPEERQLFLSKLKKASFLCSGSGFLADVFRRVVEAVEQGDWVLVLAITGYVIGYMDAMTSKSGSIPSPTDCGDMQRNRQTEAEEDRQTEAGEDRQTEAGEDRQTEAGEDRQTASEKEVVLRDIVKPRMREKLARIVKDTELCCKIHEEYTDNADIATTSRFNCHEDTCDAAQEMARYLSIEHMLAGNDRKHVERARDCLQAATAALAAMRLDEARGHAEAARDAVAEI